MNLKKLLLTNNNCYKAGNTMKPKGIMVHSTGVNNPNLKRYVGPDDGLLGVNAYGNQWNQAKPDGIDKCVHAFIGKLADGSIATYQTLPWEYVGWHSGSGSLGSAKNANNTGYIGFEICEDGLADASYFALIYQEAIDLCVYLCREYGLKETSIICHSEGYKLGVASNHGDVMHWWPKHGKSMNTFRAAVKAALDGYADAETGESGGSSAAAPATYTVQKGDSPWSIAVKCLGSGARYTEILALNGLTTASTIHAGDVLKLPTDGVVSPVTYIVQKGDSPWSIAAKCLGSGVRYTEILALNGLMATSTIHAGDLLILPS